MKKTLVFAVLLTAASLQAQTIAQWTFETSGTSIGGTSNTISGIAAEVGTGTASSVHATAATWSSPAGNGSIESFSANNWSVGDYFQFQTSTVGFNGLRVSYDQTGSNTGPGTFGLHYSTDGIAFTQVGGNYSLINGAWNNTTPTNATSYSFDLSSITALDNASSVYFRVVDASTTAINGGTVATTGTGRIDNFTVAVVPEPSTYALLGLGGLALALRRRFARK